jgi:hypothetical protein
MDAPTPSSPRDRLAALRLPLLDLHKRLLDAERRMYELAHGRVSAGELLNLALQDPQFAWLHPISELIVRIDELIALDDLPDQQDVAFIAERIRALLVPRRPAAPPSSDTTGPFRTTRPYCSRIAP